ncbi:pap2 superfamily phosphatase [Stylonychia lemnae]|uniref:Pap2 superfamily phosphatase n=1 Tax=Stylonychia lemnae TaxID=5949 RepID=A0A078B8L7_STYLE|nr:pap2 superfamily phosphatase [Stylonychia lemnae]|eukprot:CDW89873.1 pap2 superfamily phosphatase [Stylonychia lemnae]
MPDAKSDSLTTALLKFFACFVLVIVVLLLELIQRSIFSKASIESIKQLQENDAKSTVGFFKFIYFLGDARCYYVLVMLFFNFFSRQTSFYLSLVISQCVFVETFLKLVLRAGRPYMKTSKIFPFVCELSFGNPSGESMMAVAFVIVVGLYVINKLKDQQDDLTDRQKVSLAITIIFSIMMIILFSIQGSYNGNNTIDEILFGIELGLMIGCFSHFYVLPRLDKHLTNLMDGIFINRYRQVCVGSLVMVMMTFIVTTIAYMASVSSFQPEYQWLYQISVKCPVSKQLNELVFHDAVYVEIGFIFYTFGSYLGLVIDSKEYKGTHRTVNSTGVKQTLIRLAISILLIVPLYILPIFLIKSARFVLLVLLVKYGLPSFLIGFVLYGYSKLLYKRFNLISDDMLNDSNVSFASRQESDEDDDKPGNNRMTLRKDKTLEEYDKNMKKNINTF